MKRRGIAIFDVDGPVRAGGIASWPEFLLQKGLFSQSAAKKCQRDLQKLKKGEITYK